MAPTAVEDKQLQSETSIDYNKVEYKYAPYLPFYTPGVQPPLEEMVRITPRAERPYFNA